ncbi:PREDICTED: uncharacterized protein LOC104587837 [Nelumbo nucifera]|uniref:Uncharacterized protein LOC104587837 n=2 Tax=Nelumbo nucifera TaxID=4432 RepID=A0A1U7YWS2_NELNU|nr:PREDICTED: uncharacterized protein LOC104587837 [Nelumbo nucifera]DAD24597.1 TPA_asm: hypothetical protein HUJ06_026061 [Nelumbo nucifera]
MADEKTKTQNNTRLAILELANIINVPMSLNAIVCLKVADAIQQGSSNVPLSASEILACVLPTGDPDNLQCILRMLTSYDVFSEHIVDDSSKQMQKAMSRVSVSFMLFMKAILESYDGFKGMSAKMLETFA